MLWAFSFTRQRNQEDGEKIVDDKSTGGEGVRGFKFHLTTEKWKEFLLLLVALKMKEKNFFASRSTGNLISFMAVNKCFLLTHSLSSLIFFLFQYWAMRNSPKSSLTFILFWRGKKFPQFIDMMMILLDWDTLFDECVKTYLTDDILLQFYLKKTLIFLKNTFK